MEDTTPFPSLGYSYGNPIEKSCSLLLHTTSHYFTLLHRGLLSAFLHGLLFFLFGWSSNTGCNVPLIQTEKKERDNRENVAKMDCDKPWHIQDKKEEVLARHTEA